MVVGKEDVFCLSNAAVLQDLEDVNVNFVSILYYHLQATAKPKLFFTFVYVSNVHDGRVKRAC
jgi:hypothetical protein